MSRRTIVTGVVLTAILVAVAGCGTRGDLEPPGGGAPAQPVSSTPLIAPTPRVSTSVDSVDPLAPASTSTNSASTGINSSVSAARDIGPTPRPVVENSPYGKDWEYKQTRSVVMAPPAPNRQPPKPTKKPFILDKLIN